MGSSGSIPTAPEAVRGRDFLVLRDQFSQHGSSGSRCFYLIIVSRFFCFVLGNNGPCLLHIIIGNFEFEIWNGVFKRDELLKKSIRFSLTKIGWHYVDCYQQIVFNGSNVRANRWVWVNLSDLGWWLARFECDVSRSGFSSARDERLHFSTIGRRLMCHRFIEKRIWEKKHLLSYGDIGFDWLR